MQALPAAVGGFHLTELSCHLELGCEPLEIPKPSAAAAALNAAARDLTLVLTRAGTVVVVTPTALNPNDERILSAPGRVDPERQRIADVVASDQGSGRGVARRQLSLADRRVLAEAVSALPARWSL